MAIYVEVNGTQYPASITGKINDKDWDNRASKAITVEMSYSDAVSIFTDDVKWNIIDCIEEEVLVETPEEEVEEEGGNPFEIIPREPTYEIVIRQEVYDNSEYSIAGDIIDHRNGTVTVKMGKPTAEEILAMLSEVL